MNATDFRLSLSTRLAALAVAMIASSVVLGATVAGMQLARRRCVHPGDRARARHGARHAGELRRCARGALRRSRGVARDGHSTNPASAQSPASAGFAFYASDHAWASPNASADGSRQKEPESDLPSSI